MNVVKKIFIWKLGLLARWTLRKYQPKVVGVTGSVGKTSTKEAIYTILSQKFRVRQNIKNYNNEFGVPLSILGYESGYRNPFSWVWIFIRAIGQLIVRQRQYPDVLVLEMGADKPGDIRYLIGIAPCHIGVVTAIGPVHLELFGDMEHVIREKQLLVSHLPKNGYAVLNSDDSQIMGMAETTKATVITFGFSEHAQVRAVEVDVSVGPSTDPWTNVQIKGLSFKLAYNGSTVPVFLPDVLGEHQVYSALAAAAVGFSFGLNSVEVSQALQRFRPPAGRMRLLAGIKHTSLIDDTYNSSPMATKAALKVLDKVTVSGRKYVVLGDMLELGTYTIPGHREVGEAVVGVADNLITVGERAKHIAEAARERGMSGGAIFSFSTTDEAGQFVQERLNPGDIVLIKGSQGARMERVVKELMADPLRATELLVRQGKEWE